MQKTFKKDKTGRSARRCLNRKLARVFLCVVFLSFFVVVGEGAAEEKNKKKTQKTIKRFNRLYNKKGRPRVLFYIRVESPKKLYGENAKSLSPVIQFGSKEEKVVSRSFLTPLVEADVRFVSSKNSENLQSFINHLGREVVSKITNSDFRIKLSQIREEADILCRLIFKENKNKEKEMEVDVYDLREPGVILFKKKTKKFKEGKNKQLGEEAQRLSLEMMEGLEDHF